MGSGKVTKIAFKRSGAEAKKVSSAFTAHGSKFAKREEEKHVHQKEASKTFNERSAVTQPQDQPSPFELAQQQRGKRGRDQQQFYDNGDHMLEGMWKDRRNSREDDRSHKDMKKEKFEDIITISRQEKAVAQRKREAVTDATDTLDTEFNQISHLIKQRTKKDIDKYEFEHPTHQATASWWIEQKAKRESRSFTLTSDKGMESNPAGEDLDGTKTALDQEDMKLLAKIRAQDPSNKAEKAIQGAGAARPSKKAEAPEEQIIPAQSAADDDFDRMMGSMKGMGATNTLRTAKAVAAAPTEEEAATNAQLQEAFKLAQQAAPTVVEPEQTLTRKEWIQRGGLDTFDMNDPEGAGGDDDVDYDGILPQAGEGDDSGEEDETPRSQEPDAKIYGELEAIEGLIQKAAAEGPIVLTATDKLNCSKFNGQIMRHAATLYAIAQASPTVAISTFRHFLMECEKTSDTTPLALVMMYILTVIFPTTDFHHPLMTPLRLLLSHRLAKLELSSLRQVKLGLYYASLLHSTLGPQERFAAEVISMLYNIFALPIPQREVKTDQGVPLLNRRDFPTVASSAAAPKPKALSLITDLALQSDNDEDNDGEAFAQVLCSAYQLGIAVFTSLKGNPSIEAIAHPFVKLGERLEQRKARFPSMAGGGNTQKVFFAMTSTAAKDVADQRMPLAMRTFRPKPLKQFDPLMVESEEVHTRKEMRKELREDRKRVVRHLTAEASVHRKDMERTAEAEDRRRTGKYKELMGELQAQQSIMKTVDMHRTKSREKKKAKIDGGTGAKPGAGKKEGK